MKKEFKKLFLIEDNKLTNVPHISQVLLQYLEKNGDDLHWSGSVT